MVIHFGYLAKMVDMETAFLYRNLEEFFLECPQEKGCIILNKWIDGLVQAVRQCYKKAIKILKNSGFARIINQCLYMKKCAKGIVFVALYLDDNLMMGNMVARDDTIEAFKNKGLVLKIVKGLQDYLSCKIKLLEDKMRA